MHKILNKEAIAKEENIKIAAFPFLRKASDYDFDFKISIKE